MSLKDIVKVLIEFYENVGDEAPEPTSSSASASQDAPTQRMILQGLIQFLDAC